MNISGLGIAILIVVGVYKLLDEDLETGKLFGAISVLLMTHSMCTRQFSIVFHLLGLIKASADRITKVLLTVERKDYRRKIEGKYALRIVNGSFL